MIFNLSVQSMKHCIDCYIVNFIFFTVDVSLIFWKIILVSDDFCDILKTSKVLEFSTLNNNAMTEYLFQCFDSDRIFTLFMAGLDQTGFGFVSIGSQQLRETRMSTDQKGQIMLYRMRKSVLHKKMRRQGCEIEHNKHSIPRKKPSVFKSYTYELLLLRIITLVYPWSKKKLS